MSRQVQDVSEPLSLVYKSGTHRWISVSGVRAIIEECGVISRIVVGIHDRSRNAFACMRTIHAACSRDHLLDERTMIVVPYFPEIAVLAEAPTWNEQWMCGDRAYRRGAEERGPSSFEILDQIVGGAIPALRPPAEAIFIGHSAGAQYLNRYTLSSCVLVDAAATVNLRLLVSAPSSFLYLTPARPLRDNFEVPCAKDLLRCPQYDSYKYGLCDLPQHLRHVTRNTAISRHRDLRILYSVGAADNSESDPSAASCGAATMQGANRLDRTLNYARYIASLEGFRDASRPEVRVVPDVGHALSGVLADNHVRRWLAQ